MRGVPKVLALGACLGLALLNWHVVTQEVDISPAPLGEDLEGALPALDAAMPEVAATNAVNYPETLARPLLRASRRPPDAAKPRLAASPAAPKRVAKLPEGIALIGIMKEAGKRERALIRSGDEPTAQWIELGQMLNGWRLSLIEPGSVLFEAQGQKQNLSLFPARGE